MSGKKLEKTFFVSYSWGGNSYTLAPQIYEDLTSIGFSVRLDRNLLNYKSDIGEYMKKGAKESDYFILLLDGNYLKSDNCMYELGEYMKREDWEKNIFPLYVESPQKSRDIFSDGLLYWNEKLREYKQTYGKLEGSSIYERKVSGLEDTIKVLNYFYERFGGSLLSTFSSIRDNYYEQIIKLDDKTSEKVNILTKLLEIKNSNLTYEEQDSRVKELVQNDKYEYLVKNFQSYVRKNNELLSLFIKGELSIKDLLENNPSYASFNLKNGTQLKQFSQRISEHIETLLIGDIKKVYAYYKHNSWPIGFSENELQRLKRGREGSSMISICGSDTPLDRLGVGIERLMGYNVQINSKLFNSSLSFQNIGDLTIEFNGNVELRDKIDTIFTETSEPSNGLRNEVKSILESEGRNNIILRYDKSYGEFLREKFPNN